MKIKKILGLILFAFVCVLALASCGNSNGTFQTYYNGQIHKGELYVSRYNDYYLVSGEKIYLIKVVNDNNGEKTTVMSDTRSEKLDDNTWYFAQNHVWYVLINNGQELMITDISATWIYTKTDHIEGLQEG